MEVEDLEVYKKLCQLHIEVCDLTRSWPHEEKYELGSQSRRLIMAQMVIPLLRAGQMIKNEA
jgi:hypothetical protein